MSKTPLTTPRMTHQWCLDMFEGIALHLAEGYRGFPITDLTPLDDADTRAKDLADLLSGSPAGHIHIEQAHHSNPIQHAALVVVDGVADVILMPIGAMVRFKRTHTAHEALEQRGLVDAILGHLRRTADAGKATL